MSDLTVAPQVQNVTNQFVAAIDKTCNAKEKELQAL